MPILKRDRFYRLQLLLISINASKRSNYLFHLMHKHGIRIKQLVKGYKRAGACSVYIQMRNLTVRQILE